MGWEWRPYQTEVIEQVIDGGGKGLIALPLGAGKTAVAVEIVRQMGAKVIMVTAPLNTRAGWLRHFKMFMPDLPVYVIEKGKEAALELAKVGEPGVYIIGWEYGRGVVRYKKDRDGKRLMVKQGNKMVPVVDTVIREQLDWSKVPLDAVIVDESARMANRKATQSEVIHTAKHAPIKLALSATPAGNKIEGVWSSLHFLWPERFKHFWPWVNAHLTKEKNPYAEGFIITGEKSPGVVAKNIPVYARRTEEEVHGAIPEPVVHYVDVELTPAQRKIYTQFEEDALAWLDENPVAVALPVTKRMRLLQTALAVPSVETIQTQEGPVQQVTFKPGAKSSKVEALLDIMEDLNDEKVLVWSHSKRVIPVVLAALRKAKYEAVAVVGGQSRTERDENLSAFTHGEAQVLIATVPALGEGVDGLQHVCHTEVWLSLDDGLTMNKQAMGRLRRPGQEHLINRFFIGAIDTVETEKLGRLESSRVLMEKAGMM